MDDPTKNLSARQVRKRGELRASMLCPECGKLMLIGESGLVCGEAHGRIRPLPLLTSLRELRSLFPELNIEHQPMSDRLKALGQAFGGASANG